uniref:Uncharacterized protein n=1 Tax=Pseudictyota dubia TaxID=2749911 RepID=A0A7R9Z9S4_9STRA
MWFIFIMCKPVFGEATFIWCANKSKMRHLGFSMLPSQWPLQAGRTTSICRSRVNGDDGDDESLQDESSKSEPISLSELARMEEESSRRVMNRLMLPSRIGKAVSDTITFIGWAFVISSILMEPLGWGYAPREGGGLTITTLENRAFIMETRKSQMELPPPPPLPPPVQI